MKKKYILFWLTLCIIVFFLNVKALAQSSVSKNQNPYEKNFMEIMFDDSLKVRLRNGILVDIKGNAATGVNEILSKLKGFKCERGVNLPEELLDKWEVTGEKNTNKDIYNFNNYFIIQILGDLEILTICEKIKKLNGVVYCEPVPISGDLPDVTPDFKEQQGYLKEASNNPSGIDALCAWTKVNGNGKDVTVVDIEHGWNLNHEDISKAVGSSIHNNNPLISYVDHGTAVIGILAADDNTFGITGICYGSNLKTCYDIYGPPGDQIWRVPEAICLSLAILNAGDIILLECQRPDFLPVELWNDTPPNQTNNPCYLAIVNAVAFGVHVIEPACNGNFNLNNIKWKGNSGAIMVGAGGAGAGNNLKKLAFSNYGNRVDIQGWGENVITTGFNGDLWKDPANPNNQNRWYTKTFNGTSSASAIVAGAVACASAINNGLSPADMLKWLKTNGTPQVVPPNGNIGPRPNLCKEAFAIWEGDDKSNDWFTPGNWNINSVPMVTNDVLIPAGLTNYPTLISSGSCNNIYINSSIDGSATIIDNGFLTINGIAIVERYFSGNDLDWHLVSSPISDGNTWVFYNMYLQSFSEVTNSYTEIIDELAPTSLNVMEGYGLYSTLGTANTVTFNGNLNFGTKSKSFTAANQGWNLFGNPFVSSIDWETVTIPSGMSNEVHYIEASTGNDLSYVQGVGGSGSRYIPPMQGFFIKATSDGVLSIGDAQKSDLGVNNFYKSELNNLLILEVSNGKYSDQAWIHFNDQAGEEHDGHFDAYKRISYSNPELPQVYTITPEGTLLSVNGMPECKMVKLGFQAGISGSFNLKVKELTGIENVLLEDKKNGLMVNLLDSPYEFIYNTSDSPERFILHFKPPQEIYSSEIRIIPYDGSVFIYLPEDQNGEAKVYNTIGQLIVKKSVAEGFNQIIIEDLTGVYIVFVSTTNYNKNQKILLNN